MSPVATPSSCEGSNGTATAVVSGGTKPYAYNWSSGGIYSIEEGLAAGVYSVTVTDGKGCKMVEPVFVNDIGAPEVSISGLEGVGCTVIDKGSINITVTPPSLTHTYSWSTDDGSGVVAADKNQSGLTEGTYKVTVTNTAGCKGVSQAMVMQEPPDVNPICIVSVDTVSGKNVIVWEKLVTEDVSHYNVYRESSVKSDYQLLASVPFTEESLYIDSVADPTIRSWRYRLSVVDECGNESELSEPHKTMHLTMNVGLDETVNLNWDHYEGFTIKTYEVWRYDASGGWKNLDNMSSINTSFTDPNPPVEDLTYFIEVDKPGGCTTSDRKASSLNSSRSNRKTKLQSGVEGIEDLMKIGSFSVYPNPGTGVFNLRMDLDEIDNVSIKVFDISGKLVMTRQYERVPHRLETQLDLTGFSDGIYQIHVKTRNAFLHRILIKE
ncbi:T9SS type A sorting domain-containing protein [Bacteroidota bacterium]